MAHPDDRPAVYKLLGASDEYFDVSAEPSALSEPVLLLSRIGGWDPVIASQTTFLRRSDNKVGLDIKNAFGNVGLKVREKLVEGEVEKAKDAMTALKPD